MLISDADLAIEWKEPSSHNLSAVSISPSHPADPTILHWEELGNFSMDKTTKGFFQIPLFYFIFFFSS